MLSRKNYKEKLKKMEPRKERFSIRKFSIGAASVLIGFSFMNIAGNQKVQAATEDKSPVVENVKNDEQQSSTAQSSENANNTKILEVKKESNQKPDDSKLSRSATNEKVEETTAVSENDKNGEVANKTAASKETSAASLNKAVAAKATQSTQTKTLRGTQSQEVSDWQGFVNAMNDSSIGTITLTGDIDVANKGTNVNGITRPNPLVNSGKMNLTGKNISGGLDIDGQGHAINFGANYLSFDTNNQKDSNPWDIDFKNLTINADGYDNSWSTLGGSFSPIYMGGDDISTSLLAKNKVTFENVTADVKNGAFYSTTMAQQITDNPYTTVTFKGNNNITVEAVNVDGNQLYNYASAVSASHIIFADGTNTVFNVSSAKTNNGQNAGGNILRAKVEDSNDTDPAIDVQQGATVTLNGKSTDVKGMLVNSAITGTVQVDGNLNANMADGHSIAIWAGNLNIGKTGVVNIDTKQSNDGSGSNGVTNYNGYHYAPISLGVGFAFNVTNADSNILDNAGTLVIKRTGDNKSTSPLISFGSGNGTGSIFTMNVQDGATLDLQDSAQSSIAGATTNTPNIGLITMWGSGNGSANSSDTINITNPAYVNFQRTRSQTGTLLRLENQVNHVNIQSNGANNPLPLAQWDEGNYNNPSYYWYINNLTTQNNWGNNSISGFAGQGQTVGANKAGEAKFLHSNGTVTMGGSQAGLNQYQYTDGTITQGQPNPGVDYETPYLNKFLNNFNWWTPQRISMGTNLENKVTPTEAEKYQPVVQAIDGTTKQTLSDLTAKDGIKGLLSSDGTVTTDLSSVKSVSWYDAATDANEWTDVMGDEAAPINPTGNLKTSDKSAWAKVTYTDGSVDFANIPLNITQPMAETYNPSYKPVNVEQGQTATDDPSFTDQDGKATTAPTGTTFTTGTDTPTWATIDPSNGTVTLKPGTTVTPGAYNVPVTVTYPDKSTDETTVPVIVTKAGQTVTWGDNGAIVTTVDTSKLNAHETTDNSQVLSADGVVTAEGYELTDGKLSTTATSITIDPSTVSWTTTPDTTVETATATGKEITTGIKIDFTNNDAAKNILGSKNSTVTTNSFTIDAKGAGAKTVTTPVNIALGSDLTSEQFGQLVENNIPTDEIASTTWATKPDANGQGGVIKITFTDKDANGNPTYLNVNIPASSIKVTTDADENTPEGQDVSTKVGEVPNAESGIKNPGSLPSGTTYTWKDTPDTTTPGKKPAVVVVTYPDGSKDTVSTNVIVNADPEIKTITTTVGGNPVATEGIANLDNGGTTPVDGYPTSATWTTKPDTSKPGTTTGTATVTYPDGTKETVTIPVTVNKSSQVTMTYDFYSTVTIDNPDGTSTTESRQHIGFTYLGIPTDADVNVEFKNVAIPSFDGYTPEVSLTTPSAEGTPMATLEKGVDGKWTLKLPKPELSYPYYNYTINYKKSGLETPTDADKYTPEGQDVNTKTGVVPDAGEGIKNKGDLPDGTKYTWKETPDVTTAGDKPATVVVTYPDGSKDEVPVTIHVTNPTTPTDADKYTPEGQDVNTKTGVVPDPAEGIKNKGDLPDGTKYTWKETPDVSTAGDKPATVVVTYPDGSKDEVPVTIHVTNPTTPTDADKYTPEGQDVNTKTGVVPDPAEGIKNKGDLPDGTKYTWKDTPDVSTAGDKPAVVVVTYPDGSKDEVPVTIHVTNPTTPTDADKYTPEGQDVNTKTGVVPDPAEGIKNKSDLPDGTKYTWKTTPDVSTEGNKPAVVVVTYPDGSKDEVPVTIHVTNPTTPTDADKYTPEGQDVNTKTGVVPDPAEGIKNKGDLPDGTKYTWKDTPDVSTTGTHPAVVVVTYPDGSKDEVPVTIHVTNPTTPVTPTTPTDADEYTPEGQDVHTVVGKVPDPAEGIKNKGDLPDGTKYTWENTPDVSTTGTHPAVVVVTYPDGSQDRVPVNVVVTNPTPEGQDVHTTPGNVPNPGDGIKNKDEMPDGTKYTWKDTPDTTTPGTHPAVIVVHFPDGTTQEVTVNIIVDNNNNAGNNANTGNSSNHGDKSTNTGLVNNGNTNGMNNTNSNSGSQIANTNTGKKTLPQTGSQSTTALGAIGLAIASIGSLFGLGAGKKRKDQ